ncbi:hypothetical protein [uncultured Anaerococcus sp.]|uniref:hypothetical protein n=1 Tax=uncultured Anaerococcus sp. TaxID=293428 RepID=UPI00288BF88E|nr:hypothetical protein [uncultured Anaerococcus sp.]
MRKVIKIILISVLTLNLSFTSFASDAQQVVPQKPGKKIFPAESVPVNNPEDPQKDSDKKGENRAADPQVEPGKKEEINPPKGDESKNEDSVYKDKRDNKENSAEVKDGQAEKDPNQDMERLEKVVDDLVTKLDKNSNLSKALAEMQAQKASTTSKDLSQKTEEVLKDYNKKIQTANSAKERKELENEAAKKIQSISESKPTGNGIDSKELNSSENIPEKKKKILLEVKPDKVEDEEDRNQILALNPTSEVEEEEIFFLENPIVIITSIFIIALVVAIGIVIRNNDRKEKRKSNK